MRQVAQGWCTGMTLRDGMEREVEGGSGWVTHVYPSLIHVNVWQKPPQYCKVISLQLKLKKKKGRVTYAGSSRGELLLMITLKGVNPSIGQS